MMFNKYGNARIRRKGKRFDSGIEMLRYDYLCKLEKKGIISDLHRQVIFELVPSLYVSPDGKVISWRKQGRDWKLTERGISYIADFTYKHNGIQVAEDVKGYLTDVYIIKRKLMLYKHGIIIHEVEAAADPLGCNAPKVMFMGMTVLHKYRPEL